MTVSSLTTELTFTGDGVATTFALGGLDYRDPAHLVVEVRTPPEPYAPATGFTITPAGAVFGAAPASGTEIRVRRVTPLTQTADFPAAQPVDTTRLNERFDALTHMAQEARAASDGGSRLRVPEPETVPSLPAAASRANGVLTFDAAGNPIVTPVQPVGPGNKEAYWFGGIAGGTGNAHTLTLAAFPTPPAGGERVVYFVPAANTGAVTLAINGGPAAPHRRGDGSVAIPAGEYSAGSVVSLVYDPGGGGRWRVLNILPSAAGVALLTAGNTFSAGQAVVTNSLAAPLLTLRSTEAGASPAALVLDRLSASPAANDDLFELRFLGTDTSVTQRVMTALRAVMRDPAAAAAEGEAQFLVLLAGNLTQAMALRNGMTLGNPVGGFKGTGSLNAQAIFVNNVPVSGSALALIETKTLSADAAVLDFLLPSGYDTFFLNGSVRRTAPGGTALRFSADGGLTFAAASNSYMRGGVYTTFMAPANYLTLASEILLDAYTGTSQPTNFTAYIDPGSASTFPRAYSINASGFDTVGNSHSLQAQGTRQANGRIDAIRFLTTVGNLAAGSTVSLYGLAR